MTQQHSFADPDALMQRVSDMIEAGRLGVARPLLAAVKRLSPSPARLAELTARLAIGEGRLGDAEAELNAAVATAPDDRALRKRRAALRIQTGNLAGAAEDAAEAVILQRNDPAAKALLGVALMGLDQPEDAIQCLREAVAAEPNNPAFYQGLSTAEDAIGQAPAATATLDAGIQACPGSVGLRNAAIVHRLRSHDFGGAMALAEQAQRSGVADAWLHVLKGHTLSGLGRHLEAAEAYADALKLEPADPQIRHLAAASKARAESENEPGNYLRALFDGYAERFDGQLISLGYRVPGLFRAALLRILPRLRNGEPAGPVLDLGCGTGLVAVAVSDLPLRPMIGVDLSPAMLREATAKGLYAELREKELVTAISEDARNYQIILAGDVLCYFGPLDAVLAGTYRRLIDGGLFLFSVELLSQNSGDQGSEGRDWAPGPHGRFAHTAEYVEREARAAGFLIREIEQQTLRYEMGKPVTGMILALERRPL